METLPGALGIDRERYASKLHTEIALLRQRLQQLNAWPVGGDDLLALLPALRWHSSSLTEEDYHWLPLVADDSLNGIDIGSRYPAFFQKLLMSSPLRRAFLQQLDKIDVAFIQA